MCKLAPISAQFGCASGAIFAAICCNFLRSVHEVQVEHIICELRDRYRVDNSRLNLVFKSPLVTMRTPARQKLP